MKTISIFRMLAAGMLFSVCSVSLSAQETPEFTPYYKYRVALKDKKHNPFSVRHPEAFLSQRAIERRERQGLSVKKTDLPLTPKYVEEVLATGVKYVEASKWNNTLVVSTTDTSLIEKVRTLDCVASARKVATYTRPARENRRDRHSLVGKKNQPAIAETPQQPQPEELKPDTLILDFNKKSIEDDITTLVAFVNAYNARHAQARPQTPAQEVVEEYNHYGDAKDQIEQLNGVALHNAGFTGEGMVIAIIDGGFYNADIIPGLKGAKILGTRDFVNPSPTSDIYNKQDHGMMVLSCIGANEPGKLVGTAPGASFWLLRSEDGDSEQLIEEDNWAAAIEYADSVGADVVNTSLGYNDFDNDIDDVKYYELNGHTQLISVSASLCAEKGIVLVNSAGNSGNDAWKLITSPADAEDVLTIGAVKKTGAIAEFSSLGNTTDGRIKPDVVARGYNAALYGDDGEVTAASGTSFASPITCGMVTCLWQALPQLKAKQIVELVRKVGDRAEHPDNVFGYGIPDYYKAYRLGLQMK